jgi:predicted phage tail protein
MASVVLHGELAERFGNRYNLSVSSPAEAVRALCLMVPNFRESFSEGGYYLYVDDPQKLNIDEESFILNIHGDIHILPEVAGAKNKGLGKLLMGVALIGLAFVPGVNVALVGALQGLGYTGGAVAAHALVFHAFAQVGLALALGGASALLAPKQKVNDKSSTTQSYLINGSDSNIQNGSCVPLIYGEVLAAGFPISQEISDATSGIASTDPSYNSTVGDWNYVDYYDYNS